MPMRGMWRLEDMSQGARRWRTPRRGIVAALMVSLVLAGCGSRGDSDSPARQAAGDANSPTTQIGGGQGEQPLVEGTEPGVAAATPAAGAGTESAPAAAGAGSGAAPSTPSPQGRTGASPAPKGGSAPAAPGRGSAPAAPGGGSAPAAPGGGSAPAVPGGGSAPAVPGGATDVGVTGDAIQIGGVVDASSALAGLQAPFRPAYDALVRWYNARGGVNGRQLRVNWVETGGDPSRNSSGVRKLVEDAKVFAVSSMDIVGNGGSAAYLKEKNVPMVGGDSTGNFWFQYPNFYPTGSQYAGPAAMGEWAVQQKRGSKFAVLYCNLQQCTEGCQVAKDRLARNGIKPVYEALIPLGTPDMTVYTTQAQSAGADAIIACWETGSNIALLKTLERQQWYPYVSLVTSGMDEQMFNSGLSDKVLSMVETNMQFPWYTDTRVPTFSIYREAMQQAYGNRDVLEGVASMKAFSSFLVLTKALEALGPNVTRQRLMEWLNQQGEGDLSFGGAVPPDTDYRPGKGGAHRESQCTLEAKLDGKKRDFPTTSPGWLCVTADGMGTRAFGAAPASSPAPGTSVAAPATAFEPKRPRIGAAKSEGGFWGWNRARPSSLL